MFSTHCTQAENNTVCPAAVPLLSNRRILPAQPKLRIGRQDDPAEREADHMAEQIVRIPPATGADMPPVRHPRAGRTTDFRSCTACAAAVTPDAHNMPLNNRIQARRGGGQSLPAATRMRMGHAFGTNFSGVRIHTDTPAAELNQTLQARAFTLGSDIFFNRGQYNPRSQAGTKLLAHELTHVRQQTQGTVQRQVQRAPMMPSFVPRPAPPVEPPPPEPPQPQPPTRQQSSRRLNFYHGTRWSVARQIPGNVRGIGGGDFAAGFYTHHDANDRKAHFRALQWACRVARDAKEKYGGVIRFNVEESRFHALSTRNFNLTSLDQQDYAQRQADWIDFITTHGRQRNPIYQNRRSGGVWLHERRDPPPQLSDDVRIGPFYRPIPGSPNRQPDPSEFTPFPERRNLPQQVVFANQGVDLLNHSSTTTELKQHECDPLTGNVVDPPDNGPAAAAGTPSGEEVPIIQ